jgi:hypothetical protein
MKIYANTIEGCAVPNLSTIAQFRESLEQAGFKVVAFYNMADHIKKSSHKLYCQFLVYINGLAILIDGEEVSSSSTVTETALPQKHRLPQKETVCLQKRQILRAR